MRQPSIYNSQNIFLLVAVFIFIFWAIFSLANFFHESQKINYEIDQIRMQNAKIEQELAEKERQLLYLDTPQRIDKEAKMQMSKKLPGEEVLVFVGTPEAQESALGAAQLALPQPKSRTPFEQWLWLFFDRFEDVEL